MNIKIIIIFLSIFAVSVCNNANNKTSTPFTVQRPGKNWLNKYDFDGDNQNDKIEYKFSGGAHCCYRISVILTKNKKRYDFPFEMDGGYEAGLNLSRPDHFFIDDYDNDGLPEIFMEISTYNAEKYPIPEEWQKEYGIKSNYIIIEFKNNKLIVWDIPEYTSVRQYFFTLNNINPPNKIILQNKNDKYFYTGSNNKLIIIDSFKEAYNFSGGVALVKINDQYVLINKFGKIITFITEYPETTEKQPVSKIFPKNGLFLICDIKKDIFYFIDKNGNRIKNNSYEDAREFSEGLAAAKKNKKWGYINSKLKWIIRPRYDNAFKFEKGKAFVELNKEMFYINKKGNRVKN